MRNKFILLFCLINLSVAAQFSKSLKYDYMVSQRMVNSFEYHVPMHRSPRLKVTCRTALNKDMISQVMDDDLSEIFDDIEFSQFVRYNVRIRWRFGRDRVFVGAKTMGAVGMEPSKNLYYIGFKKSF